MAIKQKALTGLLALAVATQTVKAFDDDTTIYIPFDAQVMQEINALKVSDNYQRPVGDAAVGKIKNNYPLLAQLFTRLKAVEQNNHYRSGRFDPLIRGRWVTFDNGISQQALVQLCQSVPHIQNPAIVNKDGTSKDIMSQISLCVLPRVQYILPLCFCLTLGFTKHTFLSRLAPSTK